MYQTVDGSILCSQSLRRRTPLTDAPLDWSCISYPHVNIILYNYKNEMIMMLFFAQKYVVMPPVLMNALRSHVWLYHSPIRTNTSTNNSRGSNFRGTFLARKKQPRKLKLSLFQWVLSPKRENNNREFEISEKCNRNNIASTVVNQTENFNQSTLLSLNLLDYAVDAH